MSNRLPQLAFEIRTAHGDVQEAARTAAGRAIAAGQALIEAKAIVERGQWLPWLRECCAIPERTAQLYAKIAASGLKSATVADLGLTEAARIAGIAKRLGIDAATAVNWFPLGYLHQLDETSRAIWPEGGMGFALHGRKEDRAFWACTTRERRSDFATWKGVVYQSGARDSGQHAFLERPATKLGVAATHLSVVGCIPLAVAEKATAGEVDAWFRGLVA